MKTSEERVRDLLAHLGGLSYVEPGDIPDINLYIDQVTTFMESHLEGMWRCPEDKVLTRTMINNYAESNLLPPFVKKKYFRDHMFMLIFIYYFGSLLSFHDIEGLFRPIMSRHSSGKGPSLPLEGIYTEVFILEKGEMSNLMKDITAKFARSRKTFRDVPVDERDKNRLQFFPFMCELSFDVYLKTQMIEMIVDQLRKENPPQRKR